MTIGIIYSNMSWAIFRPRTLLKTFKGANDISPQTLLRYVCSSMTHKFDRRCQEIPNLSEHFEEGSKFETSEFRYKFIWTEFCQKKMCQFQKIQKFEFSEIDTFFLEVYKYRKHGFKVIISKDPVIRHSVS